MDNITAIVKTFERPKALDRLITSIRKFYPKLPILVADDSRKPYPREDVSYCCLPYNVGLSAGRNHLLGKVKTKYILLLDDDIVFTKNTKVEKMIQILDKHPLDLVGGDVINEGEKQLRFHGIYELKGGFLYHHIGKCKGEICGYPLYDVVLNFFVAKTEKIKELQWDEEIKFTREHEDFFLRSRNKLKVTYSTEFSVNHLQGEKLYLGKRGEKYVKLFNKKWNIIDKAEIRVYRNPIRQQIHNNARRFRVFNKRVWFFLSGNRLKPEEGKR